MGMLAGGFYSQISGVVTVSGESISSDDDPSGSENPIAGVKFYSDGTVDKLDNNATYTQIDSSTDWIIPNSAADGATYHVKATKANETNGTALGTFDSWVVLSGSGEADYQWSIRKIAHTTGTATADVTVSISNNGGTSTLDSAVFYLSSTVNTAA